MDQPEGAMDFKTLRAKFQDDELFTKQPRIKPALPEKPKVVPPPQSPPHYLPAGARPSLLTSINQALDGKTMVAPKVVFKEDKKESKRPLIQSNSKGKEKSESKLKGGKDKAAKGSKEKLDEDLSHQKEKKENGKDKKVAQKESTAELVPATPPPKATTQKKKGLFGFKKSTKQDLVVIPADPILDIPSPDDPGSDPLIPLPSDSRNMPEAEMSEPKALIPNMTLPDPGAVEEISPPSPIPDPPSFSPPPAIIPDIPVPVVPTLQSETPAEIEIPDLPVPRPASQNENIHIPPTASPTPPTSSAISGAPPVVSAPAPSPPEPEVEAEADMEAIIAAAVEKPPTPPMDPPPVLTSTNAERPISALSALERAEDMSPGKRTAPGDLRILSALEKARKKNTSPLSNPTRAYSITPSPTEDIPPLQSPTHDLPELPPIDYEARTALPPKPAEVNSTDNREEAITGEQTDVPELLVVPPPPPRQAQPDLECIYATPQKPDRPPSVNLREFIPPPPLFEAIPAPTKFSEADDGQEFDDVTSDACCSELPTSEWGSEEYRGPDTPDSQNLTEFYSNGITDLGIEIHSEPAYEDDYQEITLLEPSLPVSQDTPPAEEPQAEDPNSVHESTENAVSQSPGKKKGKVDSGKKRKGTPKNPYAETHETVQEKTKSGRFGKGEKKAAAEGPDGKELKKKEKQRLEKEKKEMKEKQEREKKEQKEREKKENEMKKKFKITGQEEAMYQATVTVTTKGRKNDLPVQKDDIVSIIRTTNCPKGKWLARDSSNNYGYVAVDHVELDIKEMLELGKKAARKSTSNVIEADIGSTDSRASNHFPQSAESFTDDSEEWTCDDDEPLSPALEAGDSIPPVGHARTLSMPDMGNKDLPINHQHSHSDMSNDNSHIQARNEALQKLATFFHSPKPLEPAASPEPETSSTAAPTPVPEEEVFVAPEDSSTQETEFDPTAVILPPPDLYADVTLEC